MASEMVRYEININEVDPKLLKYAKDYINENPDTTLQIISEFRDLIYERGECSPARTDDAFLLRFLRARGFIVRRAHRLLVNYCNFKDNNPDIYSINYDRLVHFMSLNVVTSMPFCDEQNRRICIFRPGAWDFEDASAHEVLQYFVFGIEVCTWEPRSQITGTVGIFDLSNTTLRQALCFTPNMINKILHLLVWSYPLRVHKIHIVNETSVFNTGIMFFRPFLNGEIQDAVLNHGSDMSSLHEHVHPKYLPERYGGIHPDYDNTKWLDAISSRKILLDEVAKAGYNIREEIANKKL